MKSSATEIVLEPLGVKPKVACGLIPCGTTRLYELLASGELDSYLDGRSRIITTASIRRRQERLLAEARKATEAKAASAPAVA